MVPDTKLYSKNEMEAIIAQRALEANRDERVHLIERGFTDLNVKVDDANHLKKEIIIRLDAQDLVIARWKGMVGAGVAIFGVLGPVLVVLLEHFWVK